MSPFQLKHDDEAIARLSRQHLESVLAVDSQSDENSESIPSTEGQRVLADQVAAFFERAGATIERDEHANVIASIPGRGAGADKKPLALMVHIDTSKGTQTIDTLNVAPAWKGDKIPYPENPALEVTVDNYPAVRDYLGHDVLFGHGLAPVGLDDKLGLAHLMTLVHLLAEHPDIPHPPLIIVGRPDEEIGRHAAVEGLAGLFAERGVLYGYTVDGILPYEVNVENFNASQASLVFPDAPLPDIPAGGRVESYFVGGVTTHGCTAKEEGHRNALRLVGEMLDELEGAGIVPVTWVTSDLRECNAEVGFVVADDASAAKLEAAVARTVDPHVPRGASWKRLGTTKMPASPSGATLAVLRFVRAFFASSPGFVLPAEESADFEGYSNPYRAVPADNGLRLDIRVRDFDEAGIEKRHAHISEQAKRARIEPSFVHQYVNMGPQMEAHPALVELPTRAGDLVGVEVRRRPIRGGTGVDPFLEKGVFIANMGTGYFALESEKEFTSMQFLAGHARWLLALMKVVAEG